MGQPSETWVLVAFVDSTADVLNRSPHSSPCVKAKEFGQDVHRLRPISTHSKVKEDCVLPLTGVKQTVIIHAENKTTTTKKTQKTKN